MGEDYNSVLLPSELRSFVPPRDIVLQGQGKKIERFIFHSQPLVEIEEKALADLEQMVAAKGLDGCTFPPNWTRPDMLRAIYGKLGNTKKAWKALITHLKWLMTMPLELDTLHAASARVVNSGVLYIHGRDCYFRPMIVLNMQKFDLSSFTITEFINATVFLLEFIRANLLLPGAVENWITIVDLSGKGLTSLPIVSIQQVVKLLNDNYRCRLGGSFVLNSPRSISMMWAMIKPILDKQTIKKVSFHREGTCRELFVHFNPNQIERKYGGTAPDLTEFWPPTLPLGPYSATA